jgi:hypothetical protein
LQKVMIRDKWLSSGSSDRPLHPLVLEWQDQVQLTLRTLIAERVRIEFDKQRDAAKQPTLLVDSEMLRQLNPYAKRPESRCETVLTADDAIEHALKAFRQNRFFVLVEGRQVEDLDDVIPFRPTSEVTFVRLVPVVGG